MQVVEKEYCQYQVQWQADRAVVKKHQLDAVTRLNKKQVQIKGFRPGKAPIQAYLNYQPKLLEANAQQTLVQEAYDQFLFENEVEAFFQPQVTKAEFHSDGFDLDMTVYTKPKFTLAPYTGFQIPKPALEPLETMVEKTIHQLALKHAQLVAFTDKDHVQEGDKITLSLWWTSGEEEKAIWSAQEYTVGSNLLADGWDSNLHGAKMGENVIFSHKFDENALDSEFENQTIQFRAVVEMGFHVLRHPVDDALAQKESLQTLEELTKLANGVVSQQQGTQRKKLIQDQIMKRLLAVNDFKAPDFLVKMEAQNLAQQRKLIFDQLDQETRDGLLKVASEMVRTSILLEKVRSQEIDLKWNHKELYSMFASRLAAAGYNPEVMKQMEQQGSLAGYLANMQDALTLDFIQSKSEIIE